jgi:hypothetical protein
MQDDVIVRLARIETKLDAALLDIDDHETRVRSLERGYWKVVGAASVIAAIVAKVTERIVSS